MRGYRHIVRITAALLLAAVNTALASESCIYKGAPATGSLADNLHHGVNLPDWWEPNPHNIFSDKDFRHIKDMGFDFVRVPITPDWLQIKDKQEQTRTLQKLYCDLVSIMNNNLAVVLDMHPGKQAQGVINGLPKERLEPHLQKLWETIAPALAGLPESRIALQLLNEPAPALRPYWWDVQGKLVVAIRKIYPQHLLIVSSIENGPWNYPDQHPYADMNLIYDFHFYQPMFLTHHGAQWVQSPDPAQQRDNIMYPSANAAVPVGATAKMKDYIKEGWNKDKLADELAPFLKWVKQYNVKPICLEFGVYRPHVGTQVRAHWLRDMREIMDTHNIPWAIWEYNEGFGILESDRNINREIRSSLGLTSVPNQITP